MIKIKHILFINICFNMKNNKGTEKLSILLVVCNDHTFHYKLAHSYRHCSWYIYAYLDIYISEYTNRYISLHLHICICLCNIYFSSYKSMYLFLHIFLPTWNHAHILFYNLCIHVAKIHKHLYIIINMALYILIPASIHCMSIS